MIQVNEVQSVPDEVVDDLTPFSKCEWATSWAVRDMLVEQSERMFTVTDEAGKPLLVLGIIRPYLLRAPDLWALLCNNLMTQPHQWRHLKWGFDRLENYTRFRVSVHCGNELSTRFVKFFGFTVSEIIDEELIFEVNRNASH